MEEEREIVEECEQAGAAFYTTTSSVQYAETSNKVTASYCPPPLPSSLLKTPHRPPWRTKLKVTPPWASRPHVSHSDQGRGQRGRIAPSCADIPSSLQSLPSNLTGSCVCVQTLAFNAENGDARGQRRYADQRRRSRRFAQAAVQGTGDCPNLTDLFCKQRSRVCRLCAAEGERGAARTHVLPTLRGYYDIFPCCSSCGIEPCNCFS